MASVPTGTSGMTSSSTSSLSSTGDILYATSGEGETRVMSERVQTLAATIYKEFERMIQRYDEDIVKELMPLVVNVLEQLDMAQLEKEEHEVELELLREDNEQLVTQYEREKALRRQADQANLEIQDHFEDADKSLREKQESLESIVRMLELKAKNASDHSQRLEERESDLKQEYTKLHDRYTELFKTHMDYMDRTKWLIGADKLDSIMNVPPGTVMGSAGKQKFAFATDRENAAAKQVADANMPLGKQRVAAAGGHSHSLSDEMGEWSEEMSPAMTVDLSTTPEMLDSKDVSGRTSRAFRTSARKSSNETSLDHELAEVEGGSLDGDNLGADLTGGLVDPAEFASAGVGHLVGFKHSARRNSSSSDMSDESLERKVNDTFFGMGKEVENLIKENTELMETKNALNVVKNDLIAKVDELSCEQEILRSEIRQLEMIRAKMNEKIKELEEDLKKNKEELDELKKSKDEEDDIPMAQRKRFTRVEMARVLMERNQYKEKLMELQEAIRWTEMIRASRQEPGGKRKKGTIWDFFSNLFVSEKGMSPNGQAGALVKYTAGSQGKLQPSSDPVMRKKIAPTDKAKALDFLDAEYMSEKRQAEKKEQYKLVRAHVKKDESGRLQAYGWSIPAMESRQPPSVPVPVYCRPLMDKEQNLKIWCAAGVLLTGGRTPDGGYIVGDSVFYSKPPPDAQPAATTTVAKLERELTDQQKEFAEAAGADWLLSSLVWICSSAHGRSRVAVIDAQNPADILESFDVCDSHLLCIASVPGAKETDYCIADDSGIQLSDPLGASDARQKKRHESESEDGETPRTSETEPEERNTLGNVSWFPLISMEDGVNYHSPESSACSRTGSPSKKNVLPGETTSSEDAILSASGQSGENPETQSSPKSSPRQQKQLPDHIKDGLSKYAGVSVISTVLPTMWMGAQNGNLYIHSSVSEWRKCLHCIKLPDAVLSIVHYKGRVFVALANGTIVVFRRNSEGKWDMSGYHVISVGKPQHSVRCMTVVTGKVWTGFRNTVHVIEPQTLKIAHSLTAHPRKESQVRQLVWIGDGVWCSIRLDSTLRLYHAHTYQHLQDVDIEPYVSKMLGTSRLGFSFVRITALLVSCQRLWIGTGNGVIISVPLCESNQTINPSAASSGTIAAVNSDGIRGPGGVVRVFADPAGGDNISPGTFLPYCSMSSAQLSFHGHKDAVKFFVALPGSGQKTSVVADDNKISPEDNASRSTPEPHNPVMMVISGGDGYIDFRIGDEEEEERTQAATAATLSAMAKRDLSHLIVWEVQQKL